MEQKTLYLVVGAFILGAVLGYSLRGSTPTPAPSTPSPASQAGSLKPSGEWLLHIDAKKHFPGKEDLVAHHYCKQVMGSITQCQLYDSDDKDARLVGVEVVVDTNRWKSFSPDEQALWHYHKEELPKVEAKLPDLSAEDAAKVAKSLEETYGKIYLLWDPSVSDKPVGQPSVTILK